MPNPIDVLTDPSSTWGASEDYKSAWLTKYQGDTPLPGAKRVTMSLGAPRTQNPAGALNDWAERIPVLVPVRTARWRLRIANRVLLPTAPATPLTQQFTLGDVFFGLPGAMTPQGRLSGSWAATPTKILNSTLLTADGSDWVSPWITDPAMQFGPDTIKQIGLALSGTNNGNGSSVTSTHHGFRSSVAGSNAINGTQTARTNFLGNTLALDKRIEYEFIGDNPVGFYLGASGDEGYNLTTPLDGVGGYEHVGVWETWPGAYGMRNRIPWVNAAIVGATQTPFLDKNGLAYTRFDLATTLPDFCVASLGGNSLLAGVSLATLQSETATVVDQIRQIGIKRIYLNTVVPVGLTAGDAKETVRSQYNDWLRAMPLGIHGVIDVDLILRDPTNKLVQMPGFVTADNIHPTHGGYQRWGHSVPLIR